MKKFAIFASGSGTNFQAIIDTLKEEQWQAKAAIVICDKPGAKVLERAEKEGIPSFLLRRRLSRVKPLLSKPSLNS